MAPPPSDPPGRRGRGRPRSALADRAILDAALGLLAEAGWEKLTMEGIAERAGVGKGTLYRRWRTPAAVLDAVSRAFAREVLAPDTGTVRDDLLWLLRNATVAYRGLPGRALPGLLEAMARNPDLAPALRDRFFSSRRAALRTVIERGFRRGELRGDLDIDLALDLLDAPLLYRLLITGEELSDRVATGVVDLALWGMVSEEAGP